jgi:tetratricopeptide (TPR) repeat protein
LVDRELVSPRPASRFADQEELVFRHAIVRDAAYDMLTDDDRALGHRLAGEWLERQGERDAVVLAQHFDSGSEKARAATYYVHAATQALEANDLAASAMLGESAVACGIGGELLGEVRRLQAEAARWMGQIADAEARATEAVALLPTSSSSWYGAIGELATIAGNQGHAEVVERVRRALVDTGSEGEPAARVIAIARVALQLFLVGNRAGDALLEIAEGIEVGDHPLARARLGQARSYRALSLGDYGTYYRNVLASRDLYDSIGDRRNACVQNSNLAYSTLFFGAHEDAEAAIAVAQASARALGLARMIAFGDQKLGQVRFEQSRFAESIEIQRRALDQLIEQGDARLASSSRASLAWALEASGNVTAAFEQAHAAIADAALVPPALAVARATLAALELHYGSRSLALELATRANATLDELGGAEHAATFVRVVCAEALHAHGRDAEARAILAPELARLIAQAANAPRPEWRTWVFERVHHHRRARDLATKWGLALGVC